MTKPRKLGFQLGLHLHGTLWEYGGVLFAGDLDHDEILPNRCRLYGASPAEGPIKEPADVSFYAPKSRAELERAMPHLRTCLAAKGRVWVAWPTSGETELDLPLIEDLARSQGLALWKTLELYGRWYAAGFKAVTS